MSLQFLGRGHKWRAMLPAMLHILGASLGGALVGGILGALGSLLFVRAVPSVPSWRSIVIVAAVVFAAWHALRAPTRPLGLQCQVRRTWARVLPTEPRFFVWGALLGAGIATIIPYSSFVVFLTAQMAAGPLLGVVSGGLFGGAREATAVMFALTTRDGAALEPRPSRLMDLLPALTQSIRMLNVSWVLLGGAVLAIAAWR